MAEGRHMTDKLLAWFMRFERTRRLGPVRRAFLRLTGPCYCRRETCPYREVGMSP